MKFKTVVADPPWSYGNKANRASPDHQEAYKTMSYQDILNVGEYLKPVVDGDALLFLWTTNSFLFTGQAARVAVAWGFLPKTVDTWVKTTKGGKLHMGMGNYTRACTEHYLICRRGKANVQDRSLRNAFYAQANERGHSSKPVVSYERIEKLSPGPYLELFGRIPRPEWTIVGHDAPLPYRGEVTEQLTRLKEEM